MAREAERRQAGVEPAMYANRSQASAPPIALHHCLSNRVPGQLSTVPLIQAECDAFHLEGEVPGYNMS
jgi:hypothetical protein